MRCEDHGWAVHAHRNLPPPTGAVMPIGDSVVLASVGGDAGTCNAFAVSWASLAAPSDDRFAFGPDVPLPINPGSRAWVVIEWGTGGMGHRLVCDAIGGTAVVAGAYARVSVGLLAASDVILSRNGLPSGAILPAGVDNENAVVTRITCDVRPSAPPTAAQTVGGAPLFFTLEASGDLVSCPVPYGARRVSILTATDPSLVQWVLLDAGLLDGSITTDAQPVPGAAMRLTVQFGEEPQRCAFVWEVAP